MILLIFIKLILAIVISVFLGFYIIKMSLLIPLKVIEQFHDFDELFTNLKILLVCAFMWQVWVWEATENKINLCGRVLALIFMSIIAVPFNTVMLIILATGELIYLSYCFFKKIFAIRRQDNE